MQLSQFKALSFDCYGTLIDWEAGLARALEPLRSQVGYRRPNCWKPSATLSMRLRGSVRERDIRSC